MDNTKRLSQIISGFAQKRIAVWGDIILDEYLYGTTRRISREAPVLILSYKNNEFSVGGGGNSLLNLKSLGADPVPVGVVGEDEAGKMILRILKDMKIDTKHILIEKDYATPVKTRILAGEETTRKQQILRIDREAKVPDKTILNQRLQKSLEEIRKQSEALIISDYDYFTVKAEVFRRIIPAYRKARIPVALDSRFRLLSFKGVSVITPNEPEVEEALKWRLNDDEQTVKKAGRALLKQAEAECILITRGSQGMALFEKNKSPFWIPIFGTKDIVDVTGAGDTVISVLSLALASGASYREAAKLANYAGGLAVMKKGTATLTPEELLKAVESEN